MSEFPSSSVYSSGKLIPGRHLGELRRSDDAIEDFDVLAARFEEDGYLFLPGFLDSESVLNARTSIIRALNDEGVFDSELPLEQAMARNGLDMAFRPDLANGNPEVHALLYSNRVMDFYSSFFGGQAMHYDYSWLRAVAPGGATPPHYDVVYMGRGTKRVCTAWIPLGDIPIEVGGLMILENSHRLDEVKSTYGEMDVDVVCENKPGTLEINDRGYPSFGAYSLDPVDVATRFDRKWLTSEFRVGDFLTFSMYTLHASTDNRSRQVRLSTDSRYQLASEPVDDRWVGEHPPAHGPNSKIKAIC